MVQLPEGTVDVTARIELTEKWFQRTEHNPDSLRHFYSLATGVV
jgi:hypothetical protein